MYRTGKSYLLNRMLLNRSGGFGVGPTINPCTKVSFRFCHNKLLIMILYRECGYGASRSKDSLQKVIQSMCSSWTQKD
jgi:hypothetical protein